MRRSVATTLRSGILLPFWYNEFAFGVAVILVIRPGLKTIFPEQMIFDLIRYAAIGVWASLAAPWVFVKM